jgi:hypothetical protein
MPVNDTPQTATVIPSLPYSITQDPTPHAADSLFPPSCDGGPVKIPLWWVYTPQAGETAVGIRLSETSPGTGYSPAMTIWYGTPPALTQGLYQCFQFGDPTEQQINLTPGVPIYFQVTGSTTMAGTDIIFELIEPPDDPYTTGDLWVSNDTFGFPAAILSQLDGTILKIFGMPSFECADTDWPSGITCVNAEGENAFLTIVAVELWDGTLNLIHTNTSLVVANQSGVSPVSCDQNGTFYVARAPNVFRAFPTTIGTITTAGVVGGTTWTLPADGDNLSSMAVARDGSILYYGQPQAFSNSAIHRYDLVNDVPLSDLTASAGFGTAVGRDMKILADGTLLVVFCNDIFTSNWVVKRYDTSGTLLNTYTFAASPGSSPRIAIAPDDPDSFWLMSFVDAETSRFTRFDVTTAAVIRSFDVQQKDAGDNDSPMFGPSQSCPLLIVPGSSPPGGCVSGTIALEPENAFEITQGQSVTVRFTVSPAVAAPVADPTILDIVVNDPNYPDGGDWQFRVYQGSPGDTSTPLSAVITTQTQATTVITGITTSTAIWIQAIQYCDGVVQDTFDSGGTTVVVVGVPGCPVDDFGVTPVTPPDGCTVANSFGNAV